MLKKYLDYLKDNPEGHWFKRKLFGWGWVPVTWQGWLITLIYTLLILLFAATIDNDSPAREVFFTFLLPVLLLTIAFIRIAIKTGEQPRWQWGLKDDENEKDTSER